MSRLCDRETRRASPGLDTDLTGLGLGFSYPGNVRLCWNTKAVITGAHRSDIQLAAMETSTKCIILTGGLQTNDVVIGKAQAKGVPIISVADDTFTTIDKIEISMGKTSIREKRKVERVRQLMDLEFDMKRFLKSLK